MRDNENRKQTHDSSFQRTQHHGQGMKQQKEQQDQLEEQSDTQQGTDDQENG
jgi:hypothetical protein